MSAEMEPRPGEPWNGEFPIPLPQEQFGPWLNRAVRPYFPEAVEFYFRKQHSPAEEEAFNHGYRLAQCTEAFNHLERKRPSWKTFVERLFARANALRDERRGGSDAE